MAAPSNLLLRLAPMVYGPTILFGLGEGAVIPLIPVLAQQLGADLATSALIASALVLGQLCGNIPASWLVVRSGERLAMAVAGTVALLAVGGLMFAPNLALLGLSVFLLGACAAAFALARHAFMVTKVPFAFRARSLSLLGGAFRFGMFVGPFVAAALLGLTKSPASAGWWFAGCLVFCVLLVIFGPDPENDHALQASGMSAENATRVVGPPQASMASMADTGEAVTGAIQIVASPDAQKKPGVFRTIVQYRKVLSRLGVAAASLAAVRGARQVVLPLWGVSLGLDAHTIALIVGISGAVDFLLFYASGQVMDRFGRLWAVLPSMVLMGAGFLALSFTHEIAGAPTWFAILAAIIGLGNGLSSGILMTLGADVAPQLNPAPFLSAWRTLNDAGGAVAPLLFSGLAAVSTVSVATGAMGIIALLGALGFWRWVPMFIDAPNSR